MAIWKIQVFHKPHCTCLYGSGIFKAIQVMTSWEIFDDELQQEWHNIPRWLEMLTIFGVSVELDVHQRLQDEVRTSEERSQLPQPLKERQQHSCARLQKVKHKSALRICKY